MRLLTHSPFLEHLGLMQDDSLPAGRSLLLLPEVRPELRNNHKAAHGGVVATLLDVAMARATISTAAAGSGAVTVEMSTRFLKPGEGRLRAEGRVLHAGRSLCTCSAEVHDESGALVASGMGTFKLLPPKGGD